MERFADVTELGKVIQGVANYILDYALLLAAGGTIAMALLELAKALTRFRLYYHRWIVQNWVGYKTPVLNETLNLAIGGSENAKALYDQPTGKMLGQLQAAANLALDFPAVYPEFYDFLTSGSSAAGGASDRDKWREFAPKMIQGVPTDPGEKAAYEKEARESTQARARLGNLVTRKLDALQTRAEYIWARMNQGASLAIGWWFFYYVLGATPGAEKVNVTTKFVLALLAGLIAPFAKDVVSALSGLRVKRT